MWQIAVWTFVPARTESTAVPVVRSDGRGYGENEQIIVRGREYQRKAAFKALELSHGTRCSEDGRKKFVSGLSQYFYHRNNQMKRYVENFGKPGADYIAQQWSTKDDKRIDRLTREAYGQGYFKTEEFKPFEREIVTVVIGSERVSGKGCAA